MQYRVTKQSRTFPEEHLTTGDYNGFICPACKEYVPTTKFSFQSTNIPGICECPNCNNHYSISR